ncbi:MAG: DUF2461 domain-containing protein [Fusobacteriaceae bacterium]
MNNKNKKFKGFSKDSLALLENIKSHNSKEWFEANKENYTKLLLNPFQNLVEDLGKEMLLIDSSFEVTPSINKTISRIYRDTRFSKDKSIYRNTMWLTFKRPKKDWIEAPSFFFEISQLSYRYGMGYYSATTESMNTFRSMINEDSKEFSHAISIFQKNNIFKIEGEKYKRPITPKNLLHLSDWYERKNIYLVHNSENIERLFSEELVSELLSGFNMLKDIYKYLCKVEQIKKNT